MKTCLVVLFLILLISLSAIEVGGTLTQDTVWSPEDNPIIVTDNLIINEGVTLTILPGTEIFINSRHIHDLEDLNNGSWYGSNDGKIIWCHGNIIAEGTEDNPILFTRHQDLEKFFWGNIYFDANCEWAVFRECIFEYSSLISLYAGYTVDCVIGFKGTNLIVNNCDFYDCWGGVYGVSRDKQIEITDCHFYSDEEVVYQDIGYPNLAFYIYANNNSLNNGVIANNIFNNHFRGLMHNIYVAYNSFDSWDRPSSTSVNCTFLDNYNFVYNNTFLNPGIAIDAYDTAYIRSNRFIGGNYSIDGGYVSVIDNYFEGNSIFNASASSIYINNIYNNAKTFPSFICTTNEVVYEMTDIPSVYGLSNSYNNLGIDCEFAVYNGTMKNSIIVGNDNLFEEPWDYEKRFQNCIVDFPITGYNMIDLGGNIVVDPDSNANLFVDYAGRDFRPAPGSPAIDAGCWVDTLNWCEYAGGFTERFWDGNGDGIAEPDIGPYEFGAPALCGIRGYTRKNNDNEEIVPYVLIHNAYNYGEFVISDSTGYFELPLLAGQYEFVVQRVFYDSLYLFKTVPDDYSWNEDDIYLTENATYTNEHLVYPAIAKLAIDNYPNPFNPETRIRYVLSVSSETEVSIYNIRGQRVKQLFKGKAKAGEHLITWNGKDENNHPTASGVYFAIVKSNGNQQMRKMLLLK
ncbi:MAG: T9SS type A sorting domain-containing protein [Candidatus Cloacimonetes bacterium]|nr:T9SS type A sorting domain-containing protein [Candidatus Cloacimonadota bacterium]